MARSILNIEMQMLRLTMAAALIALVGCVGHPTTPREFTAREFIVFFQPNDATVTPEAQEVVAQIVNAARDALPSKIVIEGQADGGNAHDANLADERANTVLHALATAGIDANILGKVPSAPVPGITGVAAHKVKVTLIP